MTKINIITCAPNPEFPNWDRSRFPESEYYISANSDEDIEWDAVVVRQDAPKEITLRCREGNVIYTSGEPPLMCPCPHSFTNQFDYVISPIPRIKHKNKWQHHGFLSWRLGLSYSKHSQLFSYQELASLEPKKSKLISIVSSNQQMMPGHNKRVSIIQKLQEDYPGIVDVYGRGYQFVDYKAEAMLPYRFHICMENSSVPDYWTEKISDPIIAQCVPIYAGCTNIADYIGKDGYIQFDVNDYKSLKAIIETLIANPDDEYNKRKKDLEILRKHIMEKENIIPFTINHCINNRSSEVREYRIKPMAECVGYKFELLNIRVKRIIFKIYYQFSQKLFH